MDQTPTSPDLFLIGRSERKHLPLILCSNTIKGSLSQGIFLPSWVGFMSFHGKPGRQIRYYPALSRLSPHSAAQGMCAVEKKAWGRGRSAHDRLYNPGL